MENKTGELGFVGEPSFVGMSAARHFRPHGRTLMSAARPPSSGDSDAHLSKLHEMQQKVGRRRARMPRPQADPNPGRTLAEALFPNITRDMGKESVNTGHVGRKSVRSNGGRMERNVASPAIHSGGAPRSNAPLNGSRRTLTTAVSSAEPVHGSQRNLSNSGSEETSTEIANDNALHSASPTENVNADQELEQGTEPPRRSKSRLKKHVDVEEADVSDNTSRIPLAKLFRGDGTLPWRSAAKRNRNVISETRAEKHPPLSVFIADAISDRSNGRLPWAQFATDSAPVGDCPPMPDDCSAIFEGLNEQQCAAVLAERNKACLVIAGPGSGKTRVLTHRIAYLVKKYRVSPASILAVTFTNKAAQEMKERVGKLLQTKFPPDWAPGSESRLAMGTFHSISARILRQYGEDIGVPQNFVICDTSDARQVMSRVIKRAEGVTPASSAVGAMLAMVSKLKNDCNDEWKDNLPPHERRRIEEFRNEYDAELQSMQQLDFDDLLLETRRLLQTCPSRLEELQDRYEYILVDEWQDTNHVQFDIVSLLSQRSQNLFVVGDADQSIYKFRGADTGNLERFMETYENITKVDLEQNYRSSGCIVAAAQSVIECNENRPAKRMTTTNEFGNKVLLRQMRDDRDEAYFVTSTIQQLLRLQDTAVESLADIAVMYRTNSQSRILEEACIKRDIPYRLAGTKFYDRQEIRDLVAYLRILMNPADDNALLRVINTPPRGIGKKTIETVQEFSRSHGVTLLNGFEKLLDQFQTGDASIATLDLKKNNVKKLIDFNRLFTLLRQKAEPCLVDVDDESTDEPNDKSGVGSLLTTIIEEVGYREYLKRMEESENDTAREKVRERLDNVEELVRAAARYKSLPKYLESVMLMVETSSKRDEESSSVDKEAAISLMTLHGGKGLEFEAVFIVGVEDNIIPIKRAQEDEEIEEERRLLYVGMTRAKSNLYITWRGQKLIVQGEKAYRRDGAGPSRFLDDIPPDLVDRVETSEETERRRRPARKNVSSKFNPAREWRVGDSVRCTFGRGTITVGARESMGGAWIEVLFSDGSKHYVNTLTQDVKLLHSISS